MALVRNWEDHYQKFGALSIPAGQEEHVSPDVQQRDRNIKALFEARKEVEMDAQDRLLEMRESLRHLQLKWGHEVTFEEEQGNYDMAERGRMHVASIRKVLAGQPPDDLTDDLKLSVRGARWRK